MEERTPGKDLVKEGRWEFVWGERTVGRSEGRKSNGNRQETIGRKERGNKRREGRGRVRERGIIGRNEKKRYEGDGRTETYCRIE